jgi:predicted transcriptional regulator
MDNSLYQLLLQAKERRHISTKSEIIRVAVRHFLAWEQRILAGNNSWVSELYQSGHITLEEAHSLAGNIEAELKAIELEGESNETG